MAPNITDTKNSTASTAEVQDGIEQNMDNAVEVATVANAEKGQIAPLSLVIPNAGASEETEPNGFDYGQGVHYRKMKKPNNGATTPAIRPMSLQRPVSYQPSIGGASMHSHASHDHHLPPSSTDREKSKHTRRYFASVTSLSYCIFLIIFGAIVYVGNAVESQYPAAEAYSLTIISISTIYFVYLFIDIRMHVVKSKRSLKAREERQAMYEEQMEQVAAHSQMTNDGSVQLSIPVPQMTLPVVEPVSHRYCFASGRHGEFLYLKLGAAWFCFGLLIHSVLIIAHQIVFFTSDDPNFYECASVVTLVFDIFFPLYSLFVLFFIFKYANVIINERRGIARLAFMHAIGTSLAFWIFTIVRETYDAIRLKQHMKGSYSVSSSINQMNFTDRAQDQFNEPLDCVGNTMDSIYRSLSPYLYPFIIEFCILIVGNFYMMYANINKCPKRVSAPGHDHHHDVYDFAETVPGSGMVHDHEHETEHPVEEEGNKGNHVAGIVHKPGPPSEISDHCLQTTEHENEYKSHIVVYADCHAASRGLFAGLILLVATIAFIILFHIAANTDGYLDSGIIMDSSFEVAVLAILIITTLIAYYQITKLDVNTHPMSRLDDVLLFIAVPAFFSETVFSMVVFVHFGQGLNIAICMCQLVQIMIQTPFIIDGLRRCSNSKALFNSKPGRELITFLTIANVSLWFYYTFSVKTTYNGDRRYEYYGDVAWSILNHLSLPLIMFYRFHSSVCLVDIWKHAYEPGGH